jgi:hypothetical protein
MDAAAMALEPGTLIGEYVVGRRLRGSGRLAVHVATQPSVNRTVALYVLGSPPGTPEADAFLARARALAAVDNASVVPVYDVGTDENRAYAATPLPAARPATVVAAEGPLAPRSAVRVIEQLAGALEALQQAGVPVDPGVDEVLLAGDRFEPVALLAPLGAAAPRRESAIQLAELLEALVGEDGRPAAKAARRAAASGSPSAVAAAARAALPPPPPSRPRRGALVAASLAAGLVAIGVVVLVLVSGDPPKKAADTVPARIAATIPIGGAPVDVVGAAGTLWVSTTTGELLRVDPRTNRVVGAPRRLAHEPLALVGGGDRLYAFDGDRNTVMRLDPHSGQVRQRRHITRGTPLTGAVVRNTLWVARQPFDKDKTGQSELIPLDSRTLRRKGRGVPVGNLPAQIRVDGNALVVVGEQDGTLTRVDTDTGDARRVLISPSPGRPALLGGRIWVPDGTTGTVTAIDRGLTRPPSMVVPVGESPAVAVARGAPWALIANQHSGAGAAARLVRLDGRGRVVGRALELGHGAENVVAADGDLWVSSIARRALLRVVPSAHVPAATRARETDPGKLRAGPSRAGRRGATLSGVRVSVDPRGTGWSVTAEPEVVDLRRYDDPGIGLSIMVPAQIFGSRGSARTARNATDLVRRLRRVRDLGVSDERATSVGGVTGRSIQLKVARSAARAAFCGGPCVPLYGRDRVTMLVQAPARGRLTVLDVEGHAVCILEDTPNGRSLPETGAILRTLRFG